MSHEGFTPGPWELCPRFGGNENAISIVGDDSIIATIWDRDAHGKERPVSANARLIAAAPDLLEALEAIRAMLAGHAGQPNFYGDVFKIADAAISKATGQTIMSHEMGDK